MILILLNAFHLWGFMAGVICLADAFHKYKYEDKNPIGLAIFLIIAGLILPLVGTATWLTPVLTLTGLLITWISITIAAWISVSNNRPIMRLVAYGSLSLSLLASFMLG